MTRHIKRFEDYVIDLQKIPQPIEETIPIWGTAHNLTEIYAKQFRQKKH